MAGNIVQTVDDWVKIKRVLVSVSDKVGLEVLVPGLVEINPDVHFFSTGGTHEAIAEILGPEEVARHLTQVSDYTGQPETQGGLVKTLDFKIYLGLLTETYNPDHQADLVRTGALPLDMVVCNLYPFEATVAREGVTVEEARANVDIGGPCMIRAAAKNYLRVASVVDPADYGDLVEFLQDHDGKLNLVRRLELACKAFAHTARYDAAISAFLAVQDPDAVASEYNFVGRRESSLKSLKFDVFGRVVLVVPSSDGWSAFYLGAEGKRRPARAILVPADIPESDIGQYLDDLCHEWATEQHPNVERLD